MKKNLMQLLLKTKDRIMRFSDLILLMLLLGFLTTSMAGQFKALGQIETRVERLQTQADSFAFISESFRKTCNGEGFSSLEEWKKSCSVMWPLDYISWQLLDGDAESDAGSSRRIFLGKWTLFGKECEVYAKCDSTEGL